MWASARANKSGYLRETFRPVGNKRWRGPLENSSGGKETGSFLQGNALLPWGGGIFYFYKAWEKGAAARLQEPARGRHQGRSESVGPRRRAHLDAAAHTSTPPGPLPHLGLRPLRALFIWSSLPGHRSPQSHPGPGHLGPRRPARASGSPARGAARAAEAGKRGGGERAWRSGCGCRQGPERRV